MKRMMLAAAAVLATAAGAFGADEPVDLDVISKIRDEGFNRSEVMDILAHLSDRIGPRLTGSPAMREANDWTMQKLAGWGLEDARLEGFEFGPGWTMESTQILLTAPRRTQLYAIPVSWHPGTNGTLESEIIYAPMKSEKDFEKHRGKLEGKIVLVDSVPKQKEPSNKVFTRRDKESLSKTKTFRVPGDSNGMGIDGWTKYKSFGFKLSDFLESEGALAIVHRSPRKAMLINATDYQFLEGETPKLPAVAMAAEHYGRAVRLADDDAPVKMSLNVKAKFHTDDTRSYSTLADIPGKGRRPELVMLGAHLDSWFMGDGAVDNGAGVAVVMEAVRILRAIGVEPKRTIRVGLWGGEEQGYYGSYQYVLNHLATRPAREDDKYKYMEPYTKEFGMFPITKKPGFDRFSVYFNLDNGSGKIRGVYGEGNVAAAAIFKKWLQPFHDLGAKTVTLNATGGTDHEVFDDIGLPGFQFIQDPLDYGSRLHHSQLDMLDHAYAKDLKQAAVIMASFAYHAAMRDARMPRKSEPVAPSDDSEDAID